MPNILFLASAVTGFLLIFEISLAWLCSTLVNVENPSIMRSTRFVILELLIPVPVAVIIGYAVYCLVGGVPGVQFGVISGLGFHLYIFLAIARSVFETTYVRAALLAFFFFIANIFVSFAVSHSPSMGKIYETIISMPK